MSRTARSAANWMVGVGIFYGLLVVMLGCGALFMYSESRHGGEWSGVAFVLGLLGTGVMLWFLAVGSALFVLQSFVRRGRRGAITGASVVCWVAMLLPLVTVALIWAGNSPDVIEMLGSSAAVMVWVALHLPIVWLLWKTKTEL